MANTFIPQIWFDSDGKGSSKPTEQMSDDVGKMAGSDQQVTKAQTESTKFSKEQAPSDSNEDDGGEDKSPEDIAAELQEQRDSDLERDLVNNGYTPRIAKLIARVDYSKTEVQPGELWDFHPAALRNKSNF